MSDSAGEVSLASDFASLVTLEPVGPSRFASQYSMTDYQGGHLFGGQTVAQALTAASHTLGDKVLHSAHSYYLRAGDVNRPVEFEVEAVRDGRSFATRQVCAWQGDRLLLRMLCSASIGEGGPLANQAAMPANVGPPESYPDMAEIAGRYAQSDMAEAIDRLMPMNLAEVRPVDPERLYRPGSGGNSQVWFRIPSLHGETSAAMQAAMLAFLSDYYVAYAPWREQDRPFTFAGPKVSSLDHAIWFHRPVICGDWLLYDVSCPSGSGATGFASGRLFDAKGALVASCAQEVLYR